MNGMKVIKIGCVLLLYGVLLSCTYEKDIWIEEEKPCAVLNAMIRQDSVIRVNMSRSVSGTLLKPGDQGHFRPLFIQNAVVELWVNGISKGFCRKTEGDNGDYVHSYRPTAGDRIKLRALTSEYDPVEAETVVASSPEIVAVDTICMEQWNEYGVLQKDILFRIKIQDCPREENFYLLSFEPQIHYQDCQSDTLISGNPFWQKIEMPQDSKVESAGMKYYDDIGFMYETYWGGYGFGHNRQRKASAFLLKDEGADGNELTFDFTLSRVHYSHLNDTVSCTHYLNVQLASISRSYYLYRRSKALQKEQGDILGDLDLREPQPTYTNVVVGYGLLASYHPIRICLELKIG